MKKVKLFEIAHGRSGDKGNAVNIGIIAREEKDYELLVEKVTVDAVKKSFFFFVQFFTSLSLE